jgi:rhodanese-related sulfurtransferase
MTPAKARPNRKTDSLVVGNPAADPRTARAHFEAKLSLETDPSDVHEDIKRGVSDFILIDARSPEVYAQEHVPGAVNLWHRLMSRETTASFPKDKLLVTYCAGVGCNASTKGALKLAALGFRVKEMIGGIEVWKSEGYGVETGQS